MQKLSFHLPHVRILGTHHCGNTLREVFKRRAAYQYVLFPTQPMDLNSDNQVEDEPFVCSIQAIYNLSAAYWCTDPTVNIYIKVLR